VGTITGLGGGSEYAYLVVFSPELPGLGVGLAQLGAGRAVVDRVVVVEHSPQHSPRVATVDHLNTHVDDQRDKLAVDRRRYCGPDDRPRSSLSRSERPLLSS